jgi:hypothetical protein
LSRCHTEYDVQATSAPVAACPPRPRRPACGSRESPSCWPSWAFTRPACGRTAWLPSAWTPATSCCCATSPRRRASPSRRSGRPCRSPRVAWSLVDELERRGVLERRPSLADRRAHALVLTGEGRRLLDRIMKVSADHEAQDLTAAGVFPPLARAAPQPGRGAHRRVAMAARGWTAPRAARPSAGTGQQVDSDRPGG